MTTKATSITALRAKARAKVIKERDDIAKAQPGSNPTMILAVRYSVWPTTITHWIADDYLPSLPQARRILEVKP